MMMRTIRPPESKQATTLLVAVRCRPITSHEKEKSRDILRVIDEKVVVVLDPDVTKEYLDRVQNRSKEKRYAFDVAFGGEATNQDVYRTTVGSMVEGVVRGLNATVFAYGATGSGKTHTMAGTPDDPGLMVLSMQTIFHLIGKQETEYEFDVTCSYLEVYNEVIYDLLEVKSGHLELREDPDQGITVAGLKRIQVSSAEKILELLHQGNSRRKTESTDANATSSRSHAVLEIIVKRKERNQYRAQVLRGRLALVDLAGSERASETHNAGQKLRDGANINRSLLALANCINALGKQQKKGLAYVPYRNSKLTRLLKDGLSGNSRTIMVATVSSGDDQYHQTINTLKYADRAKEIKTHIQTNVGTVDAHVADYQRMIDNLQVEVTQLRRELAQKESQLTAKSSEMRADDELSWLDVLSHDINENVEERINLQKALFELEDTNLHNRAELQQLDDVIAEAQNLGKEEDKLALNERRQVVLDNIRDNDEAGAHYREDIELNEGHRRELQRMIDDAISSDRNKTFLRILSQYRLLGMTNMELQFQMAVRDQIIQDQREALNNLWLVLECSGLNRNQILKIAAQQGIIIEDGIMPTRGSGLVGATPIHKQQAFSPGAPRHSSGMSTGLAAAAAAAARDNHSSRAWSDSSARDENETPASSPKTPNPEWRHLRPVHGGGGGFNWQVWSNGVSRVQTARPKWQEGPPDRMVLSMDGSVSYNGSSGWHSPEKIKAQSERCCLTVRPSLVRQEQQQQQQQQQQSNPLFRSRGRSPPQGLVPEESVPPQPPLRQKRRPRSAESQSRQSKWGAERGNGRQNDRNSAGSAAAAAGGVDACHSDDSGVEEEAGSEKPDCCWTAAASRNSDKCSNNNALDNDMLRKELSRLNNELQGFRRGVDAPSSAAMQWNALGAAARSASLAAAELPRRFSSTPGAKLPTTAPMAHSGFSPYSRSVDTANGPSSIWNAPSAGWPRAAAAAESPSLLLDASGRPCPYPFGSGEKHQQSAVPRMKLRIDRRKLRIESVGGTMKRQAWPLEWK